MDIAVILMYIIFSLILFFLLNYIEEKNKTNITNKVILSLIYMILLSGFLKNNDCIFLILIFEFLIRLFYANYVEDKDFLKENTNSLKEYLITFLLGYLLNIYFINKVNSVFPTANEFKILLWLLIIIYLYLFINHTIKLDVQKKSKKRIQRSQEYYIISYAKLKNQYHQTIKMKNPYLTHLVYALMIYNNATKSKLNRKLDILKFRIDNEPRKLGIMQINSKKIITDEESIKLAIQKIEKLYLKFSNNPKIKKENILLLILTNYLEEKELAKEVLEIYNTIIAFNRQ